MTNIQIDIRPFQLADKDAVVRLWREVFPSEPPWNDPIAMIHRRRAFQSQPFIVATQGDAIVGTVLAGYDGIARRLMLAAEEGNGSVYIQRTEFPS